MYVLHTCSSIITQQTRDKLKPDSESLNMHSDRIFVRNVKMKMLNPPPPVMGAGKVSLTGGSGTTTTKIMDLTILNLPLTSFF